MMNVANILVFAVFASFCMCIADCSVADCTNRACPSCESGYYLNGNILCDACSYGCKTCDDATACTSCENNYVVNEQGQCECIPGCILSSSYCDGQICHECRPGFFHLGGEIECVECASGCMTCDDSTTCTSCENNYVLNEQGQCEQECMVAGCLEDYCYGDECYGCPSDFYWAAHLGCLECPSGCETCSLQEDVVAKCYTCKNNYVLNGKQCEQECQISRRPIQHLDKLTRGLTIFVDFTFQCAGAVSSLEFYAECPGTFYFSAWRPSASGDDWTLHGYNTITVDREGAQNYTIQSDLQMTVEASDVIGIFYPKGRHPRIISSENIRKRERNDTSSSRFVHTRDTVDDLEDGVKRSTLANQGNSEKIIPLNAIISG